MAFRYQKGHARSFQSMPFTRPLLYKGYQKFSHGATKDASCTWDVKKEGGSWHRYIPCSAVTRWRRGATRGTMSCGRSIGTGLERAALMSRCSSLMSPLRNRYSVPPRPCALRARSMRLGPHQTHSSIWTAQYRVAMAAAPASRLHGEASDRIAIASSVPPLAHSVAQSECQTEDKECRRRQQGRAEI